MLEDLLSPELYAKMQECHTDPFHAISDDDFSQPPIMHGVTGEILKPSSKMKMPRVSRYRMRQWLPEALPKGSVQVQSFTQICNLGVENESLTMNFVVWQAPAGNSARR